MRVRQHRLYDDSGNAVEFVRSPNQSEGNEPRFLVMHFTRGASAESSVRWLADPRAKASAHLVIGRDGSITQMVAFNRRAWHAGRSYWNGIDGLNNCSIGIELDNHGDLNGRQGHWRTGWERPVPDDDVVELPHFFDGRMRGWHRYTETQLMATLRVATALFDHYKLQDVVGHDQIAPGRKLDPGPAFPMASFRTSIFGRRDETDDVYTTTAALNIRQGPGTQFAKLEESPLPAGTKVEVIASDGVWRQVDVADTGTGPVDIVGWVHSRYLQKVG